MKGPSGSERAAADLTTAPVAGIFLLGRDKHAPEHNNGMVHFSS
jgi:hypothetical protein